MAQGQQEQLDLFAPESPVFDTDFRGATYDAETDRPRLNRQMQAVWEATSGKGWQTLAEISAASGAPEASVSARLRDLRRLGWTVEGRRRREGKGTWEYRVTEP